MAISVVQTIWNLTLRVPLSTDTGLFFFFIILTAQKPFVLITYWRQYLENSFSISFIPYSNYSVCFLLALTAVASFF